MKLETFFEKFDQFADAPDAVAKMRELVLELAVTGKLVAQNTRDEPASSLLESAESERARLVAARKIRARPTAPVEEDEQPYELPSSWSWARLSHVGYELGQKVPDKRFTYIDVGGIDSDKGRISDRVEKLEPGDAPSRARKLVARGTVIYSTVRPYLLNIAIVDQDFDPEPIASTAFGILHPFEGINNRYLFYWLRSAPFTAYVQAGMKGMAYPAINDEKFYSGPVALPPLAEQKRIVAKVDELMALCDRLEAQQHERETQHAALARASLARFADAPTPANLNFIFHKSYAIDPADLRKSILTLAVQGKLVPQDPNDEPASQFVRRLQVERKDSFEAEVIRARREGIRPPKPPRNGFVLQVAEEDQDLPNTWCATRVGDVSDCLDYLRVPVNKGERLAARGTVPYYGANGQIGWIDKHLFDEDLVLVVEDETFIGRVKPFSYVIRGKSWVNNHAHVLRPLGGMTADFLNLVLCRYPFIPLTSGTTNRRKLTQPSLMDAQIALPPLAEQRRIVAKVDQLMALVDELETQLAASRTAAANLLAALVAELTPCSATA